MARVLVVEDEPGIALGLEDTLRLEGHDVEVSADGAHASRLALQQPFDLILLDIMLPGQSGFDVCRKLRASGVATPIIFLSALATETDRVAGLDLGANDYVAKPFSPRELMARVRGMLRFVETGRADRRRLDQEIEAACQVQQRLLPSTLPAVAGLQYAGLCRPALTVSGDFYDFFTLPSGRFVLLLADVCGKGMPAALLAATLHGAVRGCASGTDRSCGELLVRANRLLFDATSEDRFATMFYAVYDPPSRVLSWTNAGHCPPWLVQGASYQRLDSLTVPLGVAGSVPALQGTVRLSPGDRLLLVSDGITEARNVAGEEFGEERCAEHVRTWGVDQTAQHLCAEVFQHVTSFTGDLRNDDQTIVAFIVTEP